MFISLDNSLHPFVQRDKVFRGNLICWLIFTIFWWLFEESVVCVFELDIPENKLSDVVSILFGQNFIGSWVNCRYQIFGILVDGRWDFVAKVKSVVVSLALGTRDTEWQISVNLFEVSADWVHKFCLGVLLNLGSLSSGGFMCSNISLTGSRCSNVVKGGNERVIVMVMMMPGGGGWDE